MVPRCPNLEGGLTDFAEGVSRDFMVVIAEQYTLPLVETYCRRYLGYCFSMYIIVHKKMRICYILPYEKNNIDKKDVKIVSCRPLNVIIISTKLVACSKFIKQFWEAFSWWLWISRFSDIFLANSRRWEVVTL